MSIQPLPPNIIAQIKSSTSITSLNGVILELLKNSLDARTANTDITVEYGRGGCIVEDDGEGILPSEFLNSGSLGKPHRTLVLGYKMMVSTYTWQIPLGTIANILLMAAVVFSLLRYQLCHCFQSRPITTYITLTIRSAFTRRRLYPDRHQFRSPSSLPNFPMVLGLWHEIYSAACLFVLSKER